MLALSQDLVSSGLVMEMPGKKPGMRGCDLQGRAKATLRGCARRTRVPRLLLLELIELRRDIGRLKAGRSCLVSEV